MKKIICLILCLILTGGALTSCSKPPEYAEVEERFRELVLASAEVNSLIFGEGLPTYERVYDPQSTMGVHRESDVGEDGEPTEKLYYYYEVTDKTYGRVVAFRSSYTAPYEYAQVTGSPDPTRQAIYENAAEGAYAYLLEGYVEPEYDFFYDSDDPADYDYVHDSSKYKSVDEIKAVAESVYSMDYLSSVYESVFVGTVSAADGVSGLSARYIEYADGNGGSSLMKSNTYKPFITETRQFDFSTAKIVKPANKDFFTVEIESYLPSKPDDRKVSRISVVLQDGTWMLDSPTY